MINFLSWIEGKGIDYSSLKKTYGAYSILNNHFGGNIESIKLYLTSIGVEKRQVNENVKKLVVEANRFKAKNYSTGIKFKELEEELDFIVELIQNYNISSREYTSE